jgi:hypothetical protein
VTANHSEQQFLPDKGIFTDSDVRLEVASYLDTLYWENIRRGDAIYFWRNMACVSVGASVAVLTWALT